MRTYLKNVGYGLVLLILCVTPLVVNGCAGETPPATTTIDAQTQAELATAQSELAAAKSEVESLTTAKTDLTAQLGETQTSLEASAKLNQELAAISAYGIWFDNYYGSGIYDFDDFNTQLGSLVTATGDTNSIAAFNVYYAADQAYDTVLAGLPQDNSAWTKAQYESWRDAGQTRTQALGQIGGHLMKVLQNITWLGVQ